VILGHTNEPEYKKLQGNEMMEAFRDRTIKIDVPYNVKLDDEIKIYLKDFAREKVKGMHIAPHTIEVAAMWAVLTRLAEPKKAGITKLRSSSCTTARASRLHRGQHQGAQGRGPARRACRASARATSRTRSATPWSATRRSSRRRSTRSW
jgi:hypothetical protein